MAMAVFWRKRLHGLGSLKPEGESGQCTEPNFQVQEGMPGGLRSSSPGRTCWLRCRTSDIGFRASGKGAVTGENYNQNCYRKQACYTVAECTDGIGRRRP